MLFRSQVEKNWKDDKVVESTKKEEGGEGMETLEEENTEGADGDENFHPHAYFFVRYLCDRENCEETLALLPPSPHGTSPNV